MFFSKIKLQSLLPVDPIEEFDSWAWGEHPNGLGYKARNSLTKEQCVLNPTTAGTVHCRNYDYSYPVDICIKYPEIAGLKVCQDALYPKEFCVANPVLVSAKGCQKYLADICSLDVKLALSPPCADAQYPKDFCLGNPVLISAKGCEQFKGDICTSSLELAESSSCSGAADQITFLQCVSNGDVCRAKICDKQVPKKSFCKA
ncbi:uncharacterized protein LOC111716482 isoform X8 [Eurytemora carolleeae]|uniref:uncharacterized protein LOC111716482 isoform X8 n=1 Tax=Eurytemora carolleeae TaxID=1294199 RepID=UPI000C7873A6|nr:uncharacterized protein LOC111716482 isoform X8 [Eurytemora carolleeae]|eukprot:XP_023347722.1 uncharacterized protein LOC111716482 isoform X8 [Eurytemora affinis]